METSTKKQGPGRRRRNAAIMAVVLTAAILLGGTYAWQSILQQARNNSMGEPGAAGGRLHDDFEVVGESYGLREWKDGLTANKDIYVENYEAADNGSGPVGRDIFVRIKLYEYMEIGEGATELPMREDSGSPGTFIVNPAYATRAAESIIAGADRDDVTTWSPRLPGDDYASDLFRNRWKWTMGGQKDYMPTFNKDNRSQETDIKGDAVDPNDPVTGSEVMNTTKPGGLNAYDPEAGEHDYFVTETTWTAPEKYWDNGANDHAIAATDTVHTAKPTAFATVIPMDQWESAPYNSQAGPYWVVDTDGWFYWAEPVSPETATGLLLNSISLQSEPDYEWYYGIFVRSQMATAGDWTEDSPGGGFYDDPLERPSMNAENLLYIVTGRLPAVLNVYMSQHAAVVHAGESMTFAANVITENTNNPAWKEVNWTISPATAQFNHGTFSPSALEAGRMYTVRAAAAKDSGIFDLCVVYVPEVGKTAVVGADGNFYVNHDHNVFQLVNTDGTLGQLVCPVIPDNPGAPTDRDNVVEIRGEYYLAHVDGAHYYAEGPDGLLGTGDDELVFDNGTAMEISHDYVAIAVTPTPLEVGQGETVTLTAVVTHDGNTRTDLEKASWMIPPGASYGAGTTLTDNGDGTATLTADYNELETVIRVRVTYAGDNGANNEVLVTVKPTPPTIPVGATEFTDKSGVEWVVLKDNRPPSGTAAIGGTSNGMGTMLIVTKYVHNNATSILWSGNNPNGELTYHDVYAFVKYENSLGDFKPMMDLWYTNLVSPGLKTIARVPNLTYEVDNNTPDWSQVWDMDSAISTPGVAAGSKMDGIIFPLSISEVNRFIGPGNVMGVPNAYGSGVNDGVYNNLRCYWLRSPGNSTRVFSGVGWSVPVYTVLEQPLYYGMRPAMWIDTTP